ncbi:DUF5828 family protein [Natrinema salifodinae]|uniref:Uncharacterized protein n=1 Tax=Natrinema salifodinae TaxID=1202768 RepID=A0A1I0PMI9_9EURY|nr:DUF5828 family protein [Natrinema salifodinae]SEW15637.1 hypothetical protein SAMN05216285_2735 [Natrinema salifodinae]
MEERISGFKVVGSWGDVVEHGERITRALRELGVDGDGDADAESESEYPDEFAAALDEWDEWRPKAHETYDEDVKEKTADQASVSEGEGEENGAEPEEDLSAAGEKLSESYDALENGDLDGAVETSSEALDRATRAADTASRTAVRAVEKSVYQHVMTQLSPCYFDNELVSANVQQSVQENGDQFGFEVNINDDVLKAEVSETLAQYEDEIDRWHVDTEKNTDALKTVEGVELPPELGDQSRPTTT